MRWIIILIGCILQACFIRVELQKKYIPAVCLKGTAALFFVILGFLCADGSVFSRWILVGLIFGMAGDILLNMRHLTGEYGQKVFLVGILVFLLGHVMYLIALFEKAVKPIIPTIVGLILAVLLIVWILGRVNAKKAFKIFGVFYIGAVTLMAVAAVWNALTLGSLSDKMLGIGGILFLISDIILIFNTFTGVTKSSGRITNLSLYYLGQILIASSLYFL